MEPQLVLLVLAAALLHAVWNGLVKHSDSPLFTLAGVHLLGALAGIALASAVPAPHPDSWPFLAASVAIHTAYYALLAQAYRFGDLSYVYPLARGAAPMLVALGGSIFAAEWLPPVAIAGMVLASFGIASIGFSRNSLRSTSRPALGFALATSLAIAAYTVTDGIGVRNADSAFGYIAWLIVLEAVPIGLYAGVYRRREFGVYLRKRWLVCAAGGLASGAAYGAVIFAMSTSQMALVSALRETSVIFAALIGTYVLREAFGRQRILSAVLVTIGVMLMQL